MPVELPDEISRRVAAAASAREVRPEQVVIEAVDAELQRSSPSQPDGPSTPAREELRRMVFDGSLRTEIDSIVGDPDLTVD